jgi:c-di-AMP phosphodiesterase-like protein
MNSMGVAIPLRRIYRQVSIAQAADSMLRVGAT